MDSVLIVHQSMSEKLFMMDLYKHLRVLFLRAHFGNAHGNIGSKGVEWATGYLYLPKDKAFQNGTYLPSVFDYKNKTKVYLCDDTPVLWSDDFVVEKTLKEACKVPRKLGDEVYFYSRQKLGLKSS